MKAGSVAHAAIACVVAGLSAGTFAKSIDMDLLFDTAVKSCRGEKAAATRFDVAGRPTRAVVLFQSEREVVRFRSSRGEDGDGAYELYVRSPRGLRASAMIRMGSGCKVVDAREIVYDEKGVAVGIDVLDGSLRQAGVREEVNPPVPSGINPSGVKVGIIDSGVNYLIPEIARSLARSSNGNVLGYDFREMDDRPFDIDPLPRGPFIPVRHGTSVASVLLARGSGKVVIVPYSFPGGDPSRFQQLIDHMRAADVRIANMSLGGGGVRADAVWRQIAAEMKRAPEILFVIAAGNEGGDIDRRDTEFRSSAIGNAIFVGAVGPDGRVSGSSNYGKNVDVAAVADPVMGRGFNWDEKTLRGTSFAAPIVSALAAELLWDDPKIDVQTLKEKICAMAVPVRGDKAVRCGYLR